MTSNSIDLYLLTYNVNKQNFNGDVFVNKLVESLPDELASLYAFGVEELCTILDGSFHNVAARHMIHLDELFLSALTTKYGTKDVRFQTVGLSHIGAIGLILITPYPSKFDKVKFASTACGYAYSSMKGGVGIRVRYSPEGSKFSKKSVELTFANAHLPAYEGEVYYRARNAKLLEVTRSLDFGDGYGLLKPENHTFFMGDLNYRTTKKFEFGSEEATQLFALQDQSSKTQEKVEELVKRYDELTIGREAGDILTGFSEECITFPPTYKFHVNTAIYNSKRSPSWCDRILYQSTYEDEETAGGTLYLRKKDASGSSRKVPHVKKYSSINTLLLSDHQPVYLHITVPFNPPKSIVGPSGYLQLLPSERPNRHLHHSTGAAITESSIAIELSSFDESVSGPTQIYVLPTKVDTLIQGFVTPVSDFVIGYGLWFGTTRPGRLLLLFFILILWSILYLVR